METNEERKGVNLVIIPDPGATPWAHYLSRSGMCRWELALHCVATLSGLKLVVDPYAAVFEPADMKDDPYDLKGPARPRQTPLTYKLNHIIIPQIHFRDATVRDAIRVSPQEKH